MKVYLADFFGNKSRVYRRAQELERLGITVTSRWMHEPVAEGDTVSEHYRRLTAVHDVSDIVDADVLCMFAATTDDLTHIPAYALARGGRHFEAGMFYGLSLAWQRFVTGTFMGESRKLMIVGKRENIFHHLDGVADASIYPSIVVIPTWEEAKEWLSERAASEGIAQHNTASNG